MADALLTTNGDARRQVENGWHDAQIMRMWLSGIDTFGIARILTVHESVALLRLWQIKSGVASRVSDTERGEG